MKAKRIRSVENVIFYDLTPLNLSEITPQLSGQTITRSEITHQLLGQSFTNLISFSNNIATYANDPSISKNEHIPHKYFTIINEDDFFSFIKKKISQNLKLVVIFGEPELYNKIYEILPPTTTLFFISSDPKSKSRIIREKTRTIRYLSLTFLFSYCNYGWWEIEPFTDDDKNIQNNTHTKDGYLHESFMLTKLAVKNIEEGKIEIAHNRLELAHSYSYNKSELLEMICSVYLKIAEYEANNRNYKEVERLIELIASFNLKSKEINFEIAKKVIMIIHFTIKNGDTEKTIRLIEQVKPFVKKFNNGEDVYVFIYDFLVATGAVKNKKKFLKKYVNSK